MLFEIFITLFLVFLNGFFVAAEFAIVKVRSSQLELKAQSGSRIALLSKHITDHLDGYLAANQLGITIASLGLGWIGEPVVSKIIVAFFATINVPIEPSLVNDISLPIAFFTITVLHIVFGELMPKSIAILHAEKTTAIIAYPLHFFFILFRPFIWLLNGVANFLLRFVGIHSIQNIESHSSEELKYLVQQGKDSGNIEDMGYKIINSAFDFSEQTVKQIMVPRVKAFAIDIKDYNEAMLDKIIEENFSRIPCYEDDSDNIVGIVYLKDILINTRRKQTVALRDLLRTVLFVPETKKIGELLKEFQLKRQQIAVVVNEYGGFEGIVTMEDILEELVGEIQDEYDNETPTVQKTGEKTYTVLASATIDTINEFLPHPIDKDDAYETLAGCVIQHMGKIPNVREKVTFNEYECTVLEKNKRSIALVQLVDLEEELREED